MVSPLLAHWRYCSLALSRNIHKWSIPVLQRNISHIYIIFPVRMYTGKHGATIDILYDVYSFSQYWWQCNVNRRGSMGVFCADMCTQIWIFFSNLYLNIHAWMRWTRHLKSNAASHCILIQKRYCNDIIKNITIFWNPRRSINPCNKWLPMYFVQIYVVFTRGT